MRQVDRLSAHADFVLPDVQRHAAGGDRLGRFGRFTASPPPHGNADARQQLLQAEGFHDVVFSAELEPGYNIGLVATGGEEDNRQVKFTLQGASDVSTVAIRQADIEQNKIGAVVACQR